MSSETDVVDFIQMILVNLHGQSTGKFIASSQKDRLLQGRMQAPQSLAAFSIVGEPTEFPALSGKFWLNKIKVLL